MTRKTDEGPAEADHFNETDLRPEDGWFTARCACGWTEGPLPDLDTTIDSIMSHAFIVGYVLGQKERPPGETQP